MPDLLHVVTDCGECRLSHTSQLEATWRLEAAAEAGGATAAAGDGMDVSGSGSEWETDDEDHEALTAHMQQQQQQGVMDVDLSATAVEGKNGACMCVCDVINVYSSGRGVVRCVPTVSVMFMPVAACKHLATHAWLILYRF